MLQNDPLEASWGHFAGWRLKCSKRGVFANPINSVVRFHECNFARKIDILTQKNMFWKVLQMKPEGGSQRVVLEHFRRQPAKWPQEASRGSFWKISDASPQSCPRRPPESRFRAFQAPARKVVRGGLQRVVLKHFRRHPAKWPQEASRGSFWSI